jgi:hypothetical protein
MGRQFAIEPIIMRKPERRDTREVERSEVETSRRERDALAARRAAHARWIDDDADDPACRGID